MKTINQVTNHLISIIPEIENVRIDYDYLRIAYRNRYNVKSIDSDDELWTIEFDLGFASIKWIDIDTYEIEHVSDHCNENNLIKLIKEEIRLYDKYRNDIVNVLEKYGYEVDMEIEDYMEYYNVFDDSVSHRIIISNSIEIDDEPSYVYDYRWLKWEIERENRFNKYNLSRFE